MERELVPEKRNDTKMMMEQRVGQQREEASEVGGERANRWNKSKIQRLAETKCKKRQKRGKEWKINESSTFISGFFSPPFSSGRERKQAI